MSAKKRHIRKGKKRTVHGMKNNLGLRKGIGMHERKGRWRVKKYKNACKGITYVEEKKLKLYM